MEGKEVVEASLGPRAPASKRRDPAVGGAPEHEAEDPVGIFAEGSIFPGRPKRCPDCGSPLPAAVVDGGGVHFRCERCGAATYVAFGRMWTIPARW